jgi:glycosyltransferase involved in cell wall biosynthesis
MNQEKKQRLLREQIQSILRDTKGAEILAEEALKHGNGRKEIGKQLGAEINVKPEGPEEKKPIVAILVPIYQQPEPQMQHALHRMIRKTNEAGAAQVFVGPEVHGSSVIHWARNFLIAELIKTKQPWTHVLFLDDDIVVPEDALVKLLSHKKEIIGGLCTKRIDPPIPNMRYMNENADGVFFRYIERWPDDELVEVGAVGTGMMLITKEALEQIADAYFLGKYEKEIYGITEEKALEIKEARLKHFDSTANAFWFRFLAGLHGQDEYGEDIGFCFFAKRYCGLGVYVDTSVQPGHIGKYPFTVQDFIMQRDLKEQMKEQGQFQIPETDSKMKISICCPTRGRPENIRRLINSIGETTSVLPEVVVYMDDDDETELPATGLKIIRGPRKTLSDCWNDCAKAATGDILMFAGDDIVFKTKGWDRMVINTFESHPDKFIFVHGDDGHWGNQFGTHGFIHRKWYEAVGYLLPPYFVSDYGDTWLNDMANLLRRRVYLNFVTEHLHPAWGKADLDQTHKERLARGAQADVAKVYAEMRPKLLEDVEKIREAVRATKMPEPEPVVG